MLRGKITSLCHRSRWYGIEGQADRMDSEARELLKVVYFKPLRDALTDMTHGYKSRLAQILGAHELSRLKKMLKETALSTNWRPTMRI